MGLENYQNPTACPAACPAIDAMHEDTRLLHTSLDAFAKNSGERWLHPSSPTVQKDLLGGRHMQAWQEQKGALTMLGEDCWSTLPQVYARYATEPGRKLIAAIRKLEHAAGVVLTDCGMQATALAMDVLLKPNSHALISRQVYNKSKAYLDWSAGRMNVRPEIVAGITPEVLREKVREDTVMVFAETYTNPLMAALNPLALSDTITALKQERAPKIRLVVDNTIATPWAFRKPLLDYPGIHMVVAAGTKALAGEDRDMWGYIASNIIDLMNPCMDMQAMRGGVLSWRSAEVVLAGLRTAESHFEKRCSSASKIAAFLLAHPRVSSVFHPSVPEHPDRDAIDEHYKLHGSLLSFRMVDLDEEQTGKFCDVLAMTVAVRYALSFDGLVTKVNHHKTVSEYYTPPALMKKQGIDRLVRVGVGTEAPEDIIACLNWALWHFENFSTEDIEAWQDARAASLAPTG